MTTTYVKATVSMDGCVWGLDSAGNAFRMLGDGFTQMENAQLLYDVTASDANNVWAVGTDGNVYNLEPSQLQKGSIGNIAYVSAGGDGTICGIGGNGSAQLWKSNSWQPMGAQLTQISAGTSQSIWGRMGTQPVQWNGSSFVTVAGPPMTWVEASPDGAYVWAQTTDQRTLLWAGGGNWNQLATGTPNLNCLSAGANGLLYGSESPSQYGVYSFRGARWTPVTQVGGVAQVSCAVDGTLMYIDASSRVFRRNGYTTWEQVEHEFSPAIELAPVDAHTVWWNPGPNATRLQVWNGDIWVPTFGGNLRYLSMGSDQTLWGIDQANAVYQFVNGWQPRPGTLQRISVGSAGGVVGLDLSGNIQSWNGSGWSAVTPPVSGVMLDAAIGQDGTMCAVSSDNKAWALVPGGAWQQIPEVLLKQVALADRTRIVGATRVSPFTGTNGIWQGGV